MIKEVKDQRTQNVWQGSTASLLPKAIQQATRRKLRYLNNAASLADLRMPPGINLEKLAGDRNGQHSLRIDDQWCICFVWQYGNAIMVEITDYP